jgi:hypothetical protein
LNRGKRVGVIDTEWRFDLQPAEFFRMSAARQNTAFVSPVVVGWGLK